MNIRLLFLLLLLPSLSFAQNTFQPGYYIDNNGVITECLIKNLGWKYSPVSIEYKSSDTSDISKLGIKDVMEFSVADTYRYKRFNAPLDRSSEMLERMDAASEPKWGTETMFLKVLIEGSVTLYRYDDVNLTRYFYSNGDHSKVQQLVYKKYKIGEYIGENNYYKRQLYSLLPGLPQSHYENVAYEQSTLTKLFLEYMGEDNTSVKNYESKQNKGKFSLKITPGINFSEMKISNSFQEKYNFSFGPKANWRLGIEVEYVLPFNNNKWALFCDPNYSSYKADRTNSENYKQDANYTYIDIPLGVRHYAYFNESSKLFLDIAYNQSLTLDSSVDYHKHSEHLTVTGSRSLALGIGYSLDRYSISARYILDRRMFENISFNSSDFNAVSIILGYKLI